MEKRRAVSFSMKQIIYRSGRAFQLVALIVLPSAIWVGQIGHSEKGMIAIFAGSIFVFFLGYLLIHFSSKL